MILWDQKRVNVAKYSVEDHLIGWRVGLILRSLGDKRSDVRESIQGRSDEDFFTPFRGGGGLDIRPSAEV